MLQVFADAGLPVRRKLAGGVVELVIGIAASGCRRKARTSSNRVTSSSRTR